MRLIILVIPILFSNYLNAQENRPIEYTKEVYSNQYDVYNSTTNTRTTETGGFGVKMMWRYKGDSTWSSVGKKGVYLEPLLTQYTLSKKYYYKARRLFNFGLPGGYVVTAGGAVVLLTGLRKSEDYYNPDTGTYTEGKRNTGRIITGAVLMLGGCGLINYSIYGGAKAYERSILAYNSEVGKEATMNPYVKKSLVSSINISLAQNAIGPSIHVKF